MRSLMCAAALALAGCGLVGSNGIGVDYSFDPNDFVLNLGSTATGSLPMVPCTVGAMPDPCAQVPPPATPDGSATMFCDATTSTCSARVELRKILPIDLRNARTPLPSEAVQFGINFVEIKKIDYWVDVGKNTLNVSTPPIDLYVAPDSARDEHDPAAARLGSVAPLPAMTNACGDAPDPNPTDAARGKTVCLIQLDPAGTDELGQLIRNFKTSPFEIIAHTIVTVQGGTPVPAGMLDFFVQPTVRLVILK
jgi:hypothetical protein